MKTYRRFFIDVNSIYINQVAVFDSEYFDKIETAIEAEKKAKCLEVVDVKILDQLANDIHRLSTVNERLQKALELCKTQRDLWADTIAANADIHDAGERVKKADNQAIDDILGIKRQVEIQ